MVQLWRPIQLDVVCEVTSSKRIYAKELCPTGVPFYRSKEIIDKLNGQEVHSNPLFISEERFQEILRQTGAPIKGDLLLTSRGTLGIPYLVSATDRFHFADGNLTWFRNFNGLNSQFLKYYFLSPEGKGELARCVIGSSQLAYTIATLKKIYIPLPPLPIQQRIAGILSAYDELIENSQRRIKILESMARALYREWFVRGYSPRGILEHHLLGDICDLIKSPFSETRNGDRPLLDLSRIPQGSIAPADIGQSSELTTSRILFESGDTLFGAIRCYLHKVVVSHFPGVTNTSVLVLRPKTKNLRSLLAIVASEAETIRWADTHSTGTKMPVISWGVFQNMPVAFPSTELAGQFEAAAGPMIEQIGVLSTRIQNLRRTRDLLLPRLLSGQIEVEAT